MAKTTKQVVSGYHRPVCVKCNCEMRPEKNGIGVLDMFKPSGVPRPIGYELYDADLWKCPGCGIEIIGGFGINAISAHFEPDFQKHTEHYKKHSLLVINNG